MATTFHPYLFFSGDCREAFTRYGEIFGGEVFLMGADDAPPEERPPGGAGDRILHAAITFEDHLLMGSDVMEDDDLTTVQGMMVCYSTPDEAKARKAFADLAEGGTVTQELIPTFFSPAFGMCTDRFGTPWMVTADQPADAAG